ncbi:MAG: ATP-binding protein [Candidatus Micrarchaeota archaeon]
MATSAKDAIITQKRELESKWQEKYVERSSKLKGLEADLIKVIIGPRRSGKSFFAMHALRKAGNFGYVNFDDERLAQIKDFDEIMEAVNSTYGNPKTLLLDEIQNVDKWELLANRLQRQRINLVITGSNSNLLSMELASHLTGRHLQILLFPFSFKEINELEKRDLTSAELSGMFGKYMENGGYPEPYVKNVNRSDYLLTLFDAIIYKDIVKRFKIRNPIKVENTAIYLISNVAREFSYGSLAEAAGLGSTLTAQKYLGYLEGAFLLLTIRKYSPKAKETLSSNKKIYCIDNGFISAKALKSSPDFGRLLENVVAVELARQGMEGKGEVFYWKNAQQEEVDFLVKKGTKIERLIQVCFDVSNKKTKEREVRALLKASKELKCKELIVITEGYEGRETTEWFGLKGEVKFIPAWKWLLEEKV